MTTPKRLVLVAFAALVLGACSSAAEPTATVAPQEDQPTPTELPATSVPTETPTVSRPTATKVAEVATATQEPQKATATQEATQEAQPTADNPATPALPPFLVVKDDEWSRGPDDAPVTIIEYADFQ